MIMELNERSKQISLDHLLEKVDKITIKKDNISDKIRRKIRLGFRKRSYLLKERNIPNTLNVKVSTNL